MFFFDFNFLRSFWHHSAVYQPMPEAADESWPQCFRSAFGFPPDLPVSDLRRSLPRQSLRQGFLLLGSVPLLDVCSTDLSPQLARYRSLSSRPARQALPYGFPGASFSQHAGPCQRGSRLAHLPRLRPSVDSPRPRPLPRGIFRRGLVRDRVCLRLDDHRFVPVAVSLGKVSPPQKCGQAAYPPGRARQHSDQCLCDRRADPRCQPPRRSAPRTGSVLLARPRLCGLRSSLSLHASLRLFCHPRQKELAVLPAHLAPGRSLQRRALRPKHSPHRHPDGAALSRSAAPHRLLRCREGLAADLPDQQFFPSSLDHRPTLSGALAGGTVLSLDQTAPADQSFLRHLRERREDASVGRPCGLPPGGHCQKATGTRHEPLSNSRNSQRHDLRKNPNFRGVFQLKRSISRCRPRYPIEPVRLVMGQHCVKITKLSGIALQSPLFGSAALPAGRVVAAPQTGQSESFSRAVKITARWKSRPDAPGRYHPCEHSHSIAITVAQTIAEPRISEDQRR